MRFEDLSPRHRQLVRLAARGYTTKELAAALGTTQGAVCTMLSHLYRKLGIGGQAGLVAWLFQHAHDLPDIPTAPLPGCTRRQAAIARMVALGYRDKEIAAELGWSLTTIRREVMTMRHARGLRNRTELARWVWETITAQRSLAQAA